MSTPSSSASPRGPAEVRAALIEAAAELLSSKGDASVRAIAERAGVNHGLVHHYFGGKAALRTAALEHLSGKLAERIAHVPDEPLALASAALDAITSDDRFLRVLARAFLDGDAELDQSTFPVVRRFVDSLRSAGVESPERVVADHLARALGWQVFGGWIRAATAHASPARAASTKRRKRRG